MNKVWDITQPTDDWQKGYAKLEYARQEMYTVGDKKIEVNDIPFLCGFCGKEYYSDNPFTCSDRCDHLLNEAVDEARK